MNRKRVPAIVAAILVLVVLPAITFLFLRKGDQLRHQRKVPEFSLIATGGSRFHSSELRSKAYVAEFTYTRCRSIVCTKLDSMMQVLYDRFGGREDFALLTLTIDTRHDSPEMMRDLAAVREAGANWHFLTGQQDSIEHLIFGGFLAKPDPGGGDVGRMRADRKLAVISAEGLIRGYYDVLRRDQCELLVGAVQKLLAE